MYRRAAFGPSPRVWGSQRRGRARHPPKRSIPTCVGLTAGPYPACSGAAVHPHVRGVHRQSHRPASGLDGPSPRAWGSRTELFAGELEARSIPTCVGLTGQRPAAGSSCSVHPHVRGAHEGASSRAWMICGPSPRAWGSQGLTGPKPRLLRSIPTCVGLTPPRVRKHLPRRSIPTCVGLTVLHRSVGVVREVHPHVRGAHPLTDPKMAAMSGPSPRAWGSRLGGSGTSPPARSIPTCVGLTRR
ncbi:hypothetical protein B005_4440 [Nocardiopsis alba ATCC BAA-2165]|uniref:Uncharacterized protein n=1 Tax=Nocardiopsis alba (strain ATCC BAA-2165 / BE74) TaxID=1205910 RepID=J7L7F0_NOCAA|nr:hypothetical protein B005_4440 [Nocardiopsis alba ATCC BAA-2165]